MQNRNQGGSYICIMEDDQTICVFICSIIMVGLICLKQKKRKLEKRKEKKNSSEKQRKLKVKGSDRYQIRIIIQKGYTNKQHTRNTQANNNNQRQVSRDIE